MGGANELSAAVEDFLRRRRQGEKLSLERFPRALEDLPPPIRDEAEKLLSTPAGTAIYTRAWDILENAFVDAYGHLECQRLLRFLARYPVTDYTYAVTPLLTRGNHPGAAKLKALHAAGFDATANLCAEVPAGDTPYMVRAGLGAKMRPFHFPWLDGNIPTLAQLTALLDFLLQQQEAGIKTYIHCEAGTGRTGVAVAAVRMAIMGWSAQDALTEARNFKMFVPMQQAFIAKLERQLLARYDARITGPAAPYAQLGRYPLLRPGTVAASPRQLAMTLQRAAEAKTL